MSPAPIQQKIPIEDIRDGVLVLKDKELRAVLLSTSVNFALKSTDEQDALIYKYQMFLNSLDFPVQVLIISRQLDTTSYMTMLEQKRKEQPNELLRIQIAEYIDFVKNLVQISNIMTQSFLVIIPLSHIEKKEGNIIEKLGLFQKKPASNQDKSLAELKIQLWQRVEYVSSGLAGLGLKAVPLNTQELTELFYRLYNMGVVEKPVMPVETAEKQAGKPA